MIKIGEASTEKSERHGELEYMHTLNNGTLIFSNGLLSNANVKSMSSYIVETTTISPELTALFKQQTDGIRFLKKIVEHSFKNEYECNTTSHNARTCKCRKVYTIGELLEKLKKESNQYASEPRSDKGFGNRLRYVDSSINYIETLLSKHIDNINKESKFNWLTNEWTNDEMIE